jgi:hypothetical protein
VSASSTVVHVTRNPASGIAAGVSLGLARADAMFETLQHGFVERLTARGAAVDVEVLG